MATVTRLAFSGDDNADEFLSTNPLALIIGLLLDEPVPTERAFAAPLQLTQRLHVELDAAVIARMPLNDLDAGFRRPPALHRYPRVMARQTQALCEYIAQQYDGDGAAIWRDCHDGDELLHAIRALPGYNEQKARILVALLGKQLGVAPPGWEKAAGAYALPGYRSVADITDRKSLDRVRVYTRERRRGSTA